MLSDLVNFFLYLFILCLPCLLFTVPCLESKVEEQEACFIQLCSPGAYKTSPYIVGAQ